MAIQESNDIVNSYLQGLQVQLGKKQQEQENEFKKQEIARQQEQTKLMQDQFDQSVKQADLARKAAEANFRFNIDTHASELAQNREPDVDPTTGKPMVDANGIGTYSVQGPTGATIQLKAPTREQQQNIANLNLKKQADIRQAEQAKQLEQEHQNRLAELGVSAANAQALEAQRGKLQADLSQREINAANYRSKLERDTQLQISRINSGLDDGTGTGNLNPAVVAAKDRVLAGDITDADLTGLKFAPTVRAQVIQAGGIVPKAKDVEKIKTLSGLVGILPKVKQAIVAQTDVPGGRLGSYVAGHVQNAVDPDVAEKFNELSGYAPTISQVVGGEAGQRLTDFKIAMSNSGFLPSVTNPKAENIKRYNNLIDKLHTAADEVLSAYPKAQRDLILSKYGLTKIQPYGIFDKQGTETGQPSSQPSASTPDPNSFFINSKGK